ncbi:hypothetical protein OUZ56_025083 [Daphnia magna]|uniref:Uncharacterized protein n=1 Tax=Daphnia magna TaxID=35525 RepID=A0ABQ9ZIT6_9CRUS|nr:hypothetical protein OUZ56_025083 [Daphnia magna]
MFQLHLPLDEGYAAAPGWTRRNKARAARDEQLKKKLHWALDQDTGSPFSVARQPPTSCDVAVVVSR